MDQEPERVPLHLHTLESLCATLVAGEGVPIDEARPIFCLDRAETRALFAWYLQNRQKWTKPVSQTDLEEIVNSIDQLEGTGSRASARPNFTSGRRLALHSIRIHRFGGLHRHGSGTGASAVLEVPFTKPLTLIQAKNGAGKTSFLSAISWCLTGSAYRSQRAPEKVDQPFEIYDETHSGDEPEGASNAAPQRITAITPVPTAEERSTLPGGRSIIDTWVEANLIDQEGGAAQPLRRVQRGRPNAKTPLEEPPDLAALGLDPIAWTVGTTLPAQLPFVSLDEPTDLGKAVAALTGFAPLQDLAKHAARVEKRLRTEKKPGFQAELRTSADSFRKLAEELQARLGELEVPRHDVPTLISDPGTPASTENQLAELKKNLEGRQSQVLEAVREHLLPAFEPTSETLRNLSAKIPAALRVLTRQNLAQIGSLKRLVDLAKVKTEERTTTEALLKSLSDEAKELADLESRADTAARERLYAQLATWLRSHPERIADLNVCPVCLRSLGGQTDPVTGRLIHDHLREHFESDRGFLASTLATWAAAAVDKLKSQLPLALRAELDQEQLPAPELLIRRGLVEELFGLDEFQGPLAGLKAHAEALCDLYLKELPPFQEPKAPALGAQWAEAGAQLEVTLMRAWRAMAFSAWRDSHRADLKLTLGQIAVAPETAEDNGVDEPGAPLSLPRRLKALQEILARNEPLAKAVDDCGALLLALQKHRHLEQHLARCNQALESIRPLIELDSLVARQIGALISTLSEKTQEWKNLLYTPAVTRAPKLTRASAQPNGHLELTSSAEGTLVPTHQISNASDLKASLLAFLLAFWGHLMQERDGLSLLLLDDPQELFDRENRSKLAETLPALIAAGARVILTTNDTAFLRTVLTAMRAAQRANDVEALELKPLIPARPHALLVPHKEKIDLLWQRFKDSEHQDEDSVARDLVNELRIYLEEQLRDVLADCEVPADPSRGFRELLQQIEARKKTEPFSRGSFSQLIRNFPPGVESRTFRLLRESHHDNEIRFTAVEEAIPELRTLRNLVELCREDWLRFLRQAPSLEEDRRPALPPPINFPQRSVPVVTDLAAASSNSALAEVISRGEVWDGRFPGDRALFRLLTGRFGFAASPGSIAIVDVSGTEVEDQRLVIALHEKRALARRLLRNEGAPLYVTLSAEDENPLLRDRSEVLSSSEVRLLKVVGLFFGTLKSGEKVKGEAAQYTNAEVFHTVEAAFKVVGQSAEPLALEGQRLLAGREIRAHELENRQGTLVALVAGGAAYFKRVGSLLPGNRVLRLFESIGGRGDSIVVRTEEDESGDLSEIPLLESVREILGVLYE